MEKTKVILVTGTPGSGKSTVSKAILEDLLSKGFKAKGILINDIIKTHKLYDKYDDKFDTFIVDDKKVSGFLRTFLEDDFSNYQYLVLETHTVSFVPKSIPDIVLVLTARTDVLYDRLMARQYSKVKIDENMECEIMQVVQEEAIMRFKNKTKVKVVPCNVEEDIQDLLENYLEL